MPYIRTDKEKHPTNSRNVLRLTWIIFTYYLTNQIILQKLLQLKFERDKYIDADTSQLWNQYTTGLKHVSSVSVSRHMLCCKHRYVQLQSSTDVLYSCVCSVFMQSWGESNFVVGEELGSVSKRS